MSFHYQDIQRKEKEVEFVPGYEIGWDILFKLPDDYPNLATTGLVEIALRLGYYMGREAQRHAAEIAAPPDATASPDGMKEATPL